MRLPPGFRRDEPLKGMTQSRGGRVVHLAGCSVFITWVLARRPGKVRARLESVLKEKMRREGRLPGKSEEERIVAKSRHRAVAQRNGKKLAAKIAASGVQWTPPWLRPRTTAAIANEQKVLDIAARYSRLGEVRR